MKSLQRETNAARTRYESASYPGDLAAELGVERSVLGRVGVWGRGSAVAAVVLLCVSAWWITSREQVVPLTPPGPTVVVTPTPAVAEQPQARPPLDPNRVGVRLSEAPPLRELRRPDRVNRVTPPSRPSTLSLGSTPRRFPGLCVKRPEPSPPSSRRPVDETADPTLI